jgi:hypothetical protein
MKIYMERTSHIYVLDTHIMISPPLMKVGRTSHRTLHLPLLYELRLGSQKIDAQPIESLSRPTSE